ncbi:MAG: hypothetical protein J2P55_12670 [Rhizobiales bacterium]|nr:hypothetical protein [Hyphomicrobiales bacterium]
MYLGQLETQSNRADWEEVFTLVDEASGDPIDISLCRITMTVKKFDRNPNYRGDQYGYGYGNYAEAAALIGSTDTGEITIIDVGTFQWSFPADRMPALHQGEYQIGVRIMQDTRTVQLIVCSVNIIEGIDTQ